jgi:retron-type reverse transcriptase
MKLLEKRIEDAQFLDLIRDMLKAGYVEDWQYHKTYSGTPQGGIGSPILANIYRHEFDEFMEQKKQEFDQGRARRQTTEWLNTTFYKKYYRRRIEALKGDLTQNQLIQRYEEKLRELSERQKSLDASDPLDPDYRRLFYVRYADDYLIGIIGSKQEAETLFREITTFLNTHLKLEISLTVRPNLEVHPRLRSALRMNEVPTIITERVDDIPLLLEQMQRMGLPTL